MNARLKVAVVLSIACLASIFGGCASVPMASMDQDANSKQFTPSPNKAALYIYRNEAFGAAIPMNVAVNGMNIGQTASKTYFRLNLIPGRYKIESNAENVSSLNLSAEAGENYFVWQEVKMGMWMARSALQQVAESTGRAGVMESKQIASTINESDLRPLDSPQNVPATVPISATDSLSQQLQELKALRESNSITEEEYQKLRAGLVEKYQK